MYLRTKYRTEVKTVPKGGFLGCVFFVSVNLLLSQKPRNDLNKESAELTKETVNVNSSVPQRLAEKLGKGSREVRCVAEIKQF